MAISLYKVAKFFMLLTGVWKIPVSQQRSLQKLYFTYSISVQVAYVSYNISMILRLFQMWGHYPMSELYTFITLTILILEINYKIMIFLKNGIPHMFKVVIEREQQVLNSGDKHMVSIYLSRVKYYKIATFCQCSCSGFGILWFVILNLYVKYAKGVNEHFMYELWFPFNKEKHDLIVTIYNVVIAFYGFLFNCASQTPLQTLMVFSTTHLRILQLNVRRCFSFNGKRSEDETTLRRLILEHKFLIRFVKDLNEAIKNTIFLEWALESLHGAGALLQIISVESIIEIPYSLMYLCLLVINLGALAWSANEVIVESQNVANAVYESNWMDQREQIKRDLLFMLMRAQKPLSIDVGRFRYMDTDAALTVCKSMWCFLNYNAKLIWEVDHVILCWKFYMQYWPKVDE
ncbi:odorant receptor 10-like [Euwallacea fornicatus]|uniref:odorant receptor 10-like n=1 Tax=Euwallacea fornicatus TaxID=995702 RepID=UPI00338FE7BA